MSRAPAADPAGALRGPRTELKQVSVLFADLCGSTRQVAARSPEEARDYLERALGAMVDSVQRFGGTLSQRRGDGIQALFGAPLAQQDHALRACLAGMDMQMRMQASIGGGCTVRVGVHSGEALVGLTTDYMGPYYRADGPTLHLAARVERQAEPGQVLITEATRAQVDDGIDAESLGWHRLKDFDRPVLLHALRQRQRSAAAPLTRRRRLTPLIGRDDVVDWLNAGLGRAAAGGLVVRGLGGEAGIGKSRLLADFGELAAQAGVQACTVQGRAYLTGSAQAMVADLARALLGAGPASATDAEHLLRIRTEAPSDHLPALCDLTGVADGDAGWERLPPTQRRMRTLDALQWLLERRCREGALLLVLEDMSFADENSLRLVEQLLRRLQHLRLLVCLSYRERLPLRLVDSIDFAERRLQRLADEDSRAVVNRLLGEDAELEPVARALAERAGGNPLFLEQLAIALVDDGTLIGPPGGYRLARSMPALRVPASILAVVGELVDRLPPATKGALEAAAVLGDPIAPEDVAAMQHLAVDEAGARLEESVGPGLLRDLGGNRYGFRHALVQDSVLSAPSSQRKRQLHREALRVLQARLGDKPGDRAVVLMHHAIEGEAWTDAVALAAKAMTHAAARSANREAERIFGCGLAAARRVQPEASGAMAELGLRLDAIGMMLPLGRVDEILTNLRDAGRLASQLDDARVHMAITTQLAAALWMRGRYTEGLQRANEARAAALGAGRRTALMTVDQVRLMLLHGLGRYAEAAALGAELLQGFAPELSQRRILAHWATIPAINLLSFVGSTHWRLGDVEAAQRCLDEAYAALAQEDHPYSRGLIDFVQAQMWLQAGRCSEALALMRAAVAACEANDVPTLRPCMVAMLARALADSGQAAEAVSLLDRAFADRVHEPGGTYGEFFMRCNRAHALVRMGEYEQAVTAAQAAADFARDGEQHGHRVEALLVMAEALVNVGRTAEAMDRFELARRQSMRCGMPFHEHMAAARLKEVAVGLRLVRSGSTGSLGRPLQGAP